MRYAFAPIELFLGYADILHELFQFNKLVPVFYIADEGGGAAVLRDEDGTVCLCRTLQACGKIVAAFGKGNDVLRKARCRKCGAAAVADGVSFFDGWHWVQSFLDGAYCT